VWLFLTMLHLLYLFVHYCIQFGCGAFWVLISGFCKKWTPKLNLFIFFSPNSLINLMSNLFWLDISVMNNAIRSPLLSLCLLQKSFRGSSCFIKQESSLYLILSLLISWRSCLMWDIPAMIVNIPCVTAGISSLWIFTSDKLIFESVSYLKFLMALWQIFVKITSHMMWILIRQSDTWVPFWIFCP